MKEIRFSRLTIVMISLSIVVGSIISCSIFGNINSAQRELLAECQFPEIDAIVHLYKGNGSSATTSDSWTITYPESGLEETKIYYAYSSPAIKNILCEDDRIALIEYAEDSPSFFLPLTWIKSELIYKPLTVNKSKLTSPEYEDKVTKWEGIMIP